MPDTTVHHYFGQEVLKHVPPDIVGFIRGEKAAYDLGLQGPDLLFYYKPLKKNTVSALGVGLHNANAKPAIEAAIKVIRKSGSRAALSYLLGYVCHFVLDSGFHGEIARAAPRITDHFRLEAEMDRQIILLHYASRPETFRRHELVRIDEDACIWLQNIYPQVTADQLEKCIKSMVFYLRLLRSERGYKKKLLELAEAVLGKRGYFTAMMVNRNKNESFYETAKALCIRIEGLVPAGVQAVENVYARAAGGDPLPEFFDRNFE